jgi:hypothetical protein
VERLDDRHSAAGGDDDRRDRELRVDVVEVDHVGPMTGDEAFHRPGRGPIPEGRGRDLDAPHRGQLAAPEVRSDLLDEGALPLAVAVVLGGEEVHGMTARPEQSRDPDGVLLGPAGDRGEPVHDDYPHGSEAIMTSWRAAPPAQSAGASRVCALQDASRQHMAA